MTHHRLKLQLGIRSDCSRNLLATGHWSGKLAERPLSGLLAGRNATVAGIAGKQRVRNALICGLNSGIIYAAKNNKQISIVQRITLMFNYMAVYPSMGKALKEKNNKAIAAILVANVLFFYAVVQSNSIIAGDLASLATNIADAAPAGIIAILSGILNAQLSPIAKARIVFMRWDNPLPGSEAFTRYAHNDPRVDLKALEHAYSPLPTDPREQNALWYKFYKSMESDDAVSQVHRAFLFARDYTALSIMMLVALGIAGAIQIPGTRTALLYLLVLFAQFVLAGQAARNHGQRFVATVLAIKSTGK